MNDKKITVILVEPMKKPEAMEIGTGLRVMQDVVDGKIEMVMPFEDGEIGLIANGEGKILELAPNRAIYGDNGQIQDIIRGKFLIVYAPVGSESFESMPEELQEKYMDKFKYPEQFLRTAKGIITVPVKPARETFER